MPRDTVPVKIERETRDELKFVGRELSAKYNRDFTMSETIQWLINGYSGNPKLAANLTEIIDRRPNRLFPEEPGQ